jgi:hypothetical protein
MGVHASHPIARWHRLVESGDAAGLDALLAEQVVFHSPVVHTPQVGRRIVKAYLAAALQLLRVADFRYVRELVGAQDALLEFEATIDGIQVNGVDLVKWDAAGRITEFKVMLRPLKAVTLVHQRMAEALQAAPKA